MKAIKYYIIDLYMTIQERKQQAWLDLYRACIDTDLEKARKMVFYLMKLKKIEEERVTIKA